MRLLHLPMIPVTCAHCSLKIMVPPTVQGKQGVCFNCGQPLSIPTGQDMERHFNLQFEQGDKIADRYMIEQHVGKGGMGVVYRAHDTLVDETVALKFMNPKLLRTSKGKRLFIQEAQIARRLRHENIVAVHDVSWTNEGILYLSMEFAEGQSLRAFLRKQRIDRRYVDVRLCVTFVTQMLRALENAHRTVIHRDIKPENLILLAGERVKVLDFGLAKAVQEEFLKTEPDEQKSNQIVGTLAYAAPEQRQRRTVDPRTDIYAVGLVFQELLTLRTPMDEPVTVEQVREDVAPSILQVLKKSMHEDKEHRWQNAREFRRALEGAFNDSYRRLTERVEVTTERGSVSTENMVFMEGGNFLMGNDSLRESAPEEEVYVAPFWIDAYPVTVKEYSDYIAATKAPEPKYWRDAQYNGPDQPVIGITWQDAQRYAEWAGKRLPTEAQWEFAARGKENRTYPWGSLPADTTRCNFADYLSMPSIVTMHEDGCTPDKVYDLAGNVMEWTLDPFISYKKIRQEPDIILDAPRRAVRGGCFNSPQEDLRTYVRRGVFPESQLPTVGFRCVLPAGASRFS